MNREKALALLPILIAFAEGKRIQKKLLVNDQWVYAGDDIEFSCAADRYRIEPEPRRLYRVEFVSSSRWWAHRESRESAETSLKEAQLLNAGDEFRIVEFLEQVK